jgi:hypothetical protein
MLGREHGTGDRAILSYRQCRCGAVALAETMIDTPRRLTNFDRCFVGGAARNSVGR